MKRHQDVYEKPIIFTFRNAIVRVYRPILTEEEQAKRRKAIEKAAIALLKESYRSEKKNTERKDIAP